MSSTNNSSSSSKNMYERKSDEALDAIVKRVQQVEPSFMKSEGKCLDAKGLSTASTYWAVEVELGEKGFRRVGGSMTVVNVTFDDGEKMEVFLPEKAYNRFFKLLQSQRGKRIGILSFNYNPADNSMMFRDVGTMVLIQDAEGDMVIPACNYGPHALYSEPALAVSRFAGSKRLASELDDSVPVPSRAVVPKRVAVPSTDGAILGGRSTVAGSLDFANLDRTELIALLAKLVAPVVDL
jgi:hypothetical protein